MTKKKFMRWKLKTLPTPSDIATLIDKGVITKEEAREILFSPEEIEGDRDLESFKAEIKFLRELVEKLANSQKVVEVIREIEKPYSGLKWYEPYKVWYNSYTWDYDRMICGTTVDSTTPGETIKKFSDIKTF